MQLTGWYTHAVFENRVVPGLVSLPCQPARGASHAHVGLLLPFSQILSAL